MMLQLRADLGQLKRIRTYVTETATGLGVAAHAIDDLCLAVDEVATNIITHGYGGAGDIEVELRVDGPDLILVLRDRAPAFDLVGTAPGALTPPEERDAPGGFGIYLIHSVMDEVSYRQTPDGNELTMLKRGVISETA
jgi:serine/threonine-protein kinase RsbW